MEIFRIYCRLRSNDRFIGLRGFLLTSFKYLEENVKIDS